MAPVWSAKPAAPPALPASSETSPDGSAILRTLCPPRSHTSANDESNEITTSLGLTNVACVAVPSALPDAPLPHSVVTSNVTRSIWRTRRLPKSLTRANAPLGATATPVGPLNEASVRDPSAKAAEPEPMAVTAPVERSTRRTMFAAESASRKDLSAAMSTPTDAPDEVSVVTATGTYESG